MTTEQATKILAEEIHFGALHTPSLKTLKQAAGCYLTEDDYDRWFQRGKKSKYDPKAKKYSDYIGAINDNARQWNWTAVSTLIEACYSFLGAAPPPLGSGGGHSTGYAYHCGNHPIQWAISKIEVDQSENGGTK